MKATTRQILIILTTLVTLTVNGLANTLPLNGLNTGEISDSFDIYFVPAGYVFSIWGVIYLGLLLYAVYLHARSSLGVSVVCARKMKQGVCRLHFYLYRGVLRIDRLFHT